MIERRIASVTTHIEISEYGERLGTVVLDVPAKHDDGPYSALVRQPDGGYRALEGAWLTQELAESAVILAYHRLAREAETLPPPVANGGG